MTIRQYKMYQKFRLNRYNIEAVSQLDQRTFGSLCHRDWINFDFKSKPSDGWFQITGRGEEEFARITGWTMLRNNASLPLSKFVPRAAVRAARRIA